jgi:hypothetical protein
MRVRKRLALVALLAFCLLVGNRLGVALAGYFQGAVLAPRLIAQHRESRLSMRLRRVNVGAPGRLVVSGALEVGVPDNFPNRLDIGVRITVADGTVLVNEIIGHCDVAKDVQQTEYPILWTYWLPPGRYWVDLVALDWPRLLAADGVTIVPSCSDTAVYSVH